MIITNADFKTFILIKLVTSLIYLVINYITHKCTLPVTLANVLRLLISCLDSLILLVLLSRYILEWCYMAYEYSIIGVLFSILICALNWAILVRDERVQPVFIIGTFCFIVLFILYILSVYFYGTGLQRHVICSVHV